MTYIALTETATMLLSIHPYSTQVSYSLNWTFLLSTSQPPSRYWYKYMVILVLEFFSFFKNIFHFSSIYTSTAHIHITSTLNLPYIIFAGRIPLHHTPHHTITHHHTHPPTTSPTTMPRTKATMKKAVPALRSAPLPGAGVVRNSKRRSTSHPLILLPPPPPP